MTLKVGKLNSEDCENKTMKEIIETVIMPDIMKKEKKSREENIEARNPENFGELIAILKKEHEETFKDVTLEAQLDKFVDEQQELINADNCLEEARELADMIIVAAGIARFAPRFVDEVIKPYIQRKIGDEEKINSVICYMALEKSLINKERKWDKKGGKYQHK
jgi:hypothetical protein